MKLCSVHGPISRQQPRSYLESTAFYERTFVGSNDAANHHGDGGWRGDGLGPLSDLGDLVELFISSGNLSCLSGRQPTALRPVHIAQHKYPEAASGQAAPQPPIKSDSLSPCASMNHGTGAALEAGHEIGQEARRTRGRVDHFWGGAALAQADTGVRYKCMHNRRDSGGVINLAEVSYIDCIVFVPPSDSSYMLQALARP
jgi:hypothetical protein